MPELRRGAFVLLPVLTASLGVAFLSGAELLQPHTVAVLGALIRGLAPAAGLLVLFVVLTVQFVLLLARTAERVFTADPPAIPKRRRNSARGRFRRRSSRLLGVFLSLREHSPPSRHPLLVAPL